MVAGPGDGIEDGHETRAGRTPKAAGNPKPEVPDARGPLEGGGPAAHAWHRRSAAAQGAQRSRHVTRRHERVPRGVSTAQRSSSQHVRVLIFARKQLTVPLKRRGQATQAGCLWAKMNIRTCGEGLLCIGAVGGGPAGWSHRTSHAWLGAGAGLLEVAVLRAGGAMPRSMPEATLYIANSPCEPPDCAAFARHCWLSPRPTEGHATRLTTRFPVSTAGGKQKCPMALFFARVQLNGDPTAGQYETLHARMATIGFNMQITTANGTWELPHATYAANNYVNANVASGAVKTVADAVVADSRVLVTSGADFQGSGLKKIR